jgi:hypothetical protein
MAGLPSRFEPPEAERHPGSQEFSLVTEIIAIGRFIGQESIQHRI